MKTKILAVSNAMSFIAQLIVVYLIQAKQLNALTIGEVSDKYQTLFTPAGITFSIWGLIYVSLAIFCLYHLWVAFTQPENHHSNKDIRDIGLFFLINNLATALWSVMWVWENLFISVLLILVQLGTLIYISIRAHISNPERPLSTKIFTQFPLSIYFGWISIATIANISAALEGSGWDGFGVSPSYWAVILIGASSLLTLFIVVVRRNFFFGLVVIWAFYGLILKLKEQAFEAQNENVTLAAWAGIVMIVIALAIRIFRKYEPYNENLVSAESMH